MHFIGIDPGIRDTGVVRMSFYLASRHVVVSPLVVQNLGDINNLNKLREWVDIQPGRDERVFIEKYSPRPGMGTNARMVELEHMLKDVLPKAKLIRNTGVQQIVTRELMDLFNVWRFAKSTHHNDLRSAARIGIYGALKEDSFNKLIASVVIDHVGAATWRVEVEEVQSIGP